jgi:hypothetical protein
LFEKFYIGLFEHAGSGRGDLQFFDVSSQPPQFGRPTSGFLGPDEFIRAVVKAYDARNEIKPAWKREEEFLPTTLDLQQQELLPEVVDEEESEP